ncbi:RimK/LysX family protein [Methylomarinum sp. Ch1-1]|uniref:RimK/LysX family protein n=1 Tax=Methylomarinum roseum TaxID=3067653 RepID=A0AAU7NWJ6_9GAMM|nr:RimK/LysX family protein [Methylomarinum sp. Ch1-1]MDP4522503.1 RimK/LysX family protein [Methylomarinum sp. Ch1-1]
MSNLFPMLGWREWIALPELDLPPIKVKIDTGARTSALHAFFVDPYKKGKQHWVRFGIHPHPHDSELAIECEARVKDRRMVSDSGGHKQRRFVIETPMLIGHTLFKAEMTLTNRDTMKFRMLLGRTAMNERFIVNPAESYLQGKPVFGERDD